jgi:hypothetical protein
MPPCRIWILSENEQTTNNDNSGIGEERSHSWHLDAADRAGNVPRHVGGSNMPPLAFDDEMLDRLTNAAALLPSNARDGFMRSVANRISDPPYAPGMAELEQAISFVLGCRGIGGGFQAFNHTRHRTSSSPAHGPSVNSNPGVAYEQTSFLLSQRT